MAFIAVAAVSSGALAVGSFVSVHAYRTQNFNDRADRLTAVNLALAAGSDHPDDLAPLLEIYDRRGGVETVAVWPDGEVSSSVPGQRALIDGLPSVVEGGGPTSGGVVEVAGRPYRVVGGVPPDSPARLYFFYSLAGLRAGLHQLLVSLVVGWVVVIGLAAVVGSLVARRALAPVARASGAARQLAEGLLSARLPDERGDEFGAWARYFNEMAAALGTKIEQLTAANERERRFTGNVAHELRTPLGALVSNASLVRARLDELPPDLRRPAELLVQDVGRLRTLVLDLLELARIDSGQQEVHTEEISLDLVVDAVVAANRFDPPPGTDVERVLVLADRRRLDRIVTNLLQNACVHGAGRVCVRASAEDGWGVVEVEDDGPGIPAGSRERVFERFYKADTSHSTVGSGLGLAIARENARLLGGDVVLADARDGNEGGGLGGARFVVRLPLAAVSEPGPAPGPPAPACAR